MSLQPDEIRCDETYLRSRIKSGNAGWSQRQRSLPNEDNMRAMFKACFDTYLASVPAQRPGGKLRAKMGTKYKVNLEEQLDRNT